MQRWSSGKWWPTTRSRTAAACWRSRRRRMQIFITLASNGRTLTAEVETGDSVEALREQIRALAADKLPAHVCADPEFQRLFFGTTLLEDGHALAEYAVQKDSELTLALRPKQLPFDVEVGGRSFSVTLDTIMAAPKSRLCAMFEPMVQGGVPVDAPPPGPGGLPEGVPGQGPRPLLRKASGAYVIAGDGDADIFGRHVLPFLIARQPVYRNGQRAEPQPAPEPCVLPAKDGLAHLRAEASAFGLQELVGLVDAELSRIEAEELRARQAAEQERRQQEAEAEAKRKAEEGAKACASTMHCKECSAPLLDMADSFLEDGFRSASGEAVCKTFSLDCMSMFASLTQGVAIAVDVQAHVAGGGDLRPCPSSVDDHG